MMAIQVNFYSLGDTTQQLYWQFCCRLLQKVYQQKHDVYVHCAEQHSAQQLNIQLWTFNDISFIPHSFADVPITLSPMIYIGYSNQIPQTTDILLNLSPTVPDFFQHFSRVLEVVTPTTRDAGRQRYRQYQQQHCQLQTHQLDQ